GATWPGARRSSDLPGAPKGKGGSPRADCPRSGRRGTRAPRMTVRRTLVDLAVALVAIAAIAVVLEIWTRAFRVPSYLLPAPSAVAARMATDAGLLAREGGITLSEAAAGFVLGTGVAFALATMMAWSRPLE